MKKNKALFIISVIYLVAFVLAAAISMRVDGIIIKQLLFDVVATVVIFIFSTLLVNSSVYDAYWSLTPMIMSIWLFADARAFSVMQLLFLFVFNIWAVRLTVNWVHVFTDFTYEDWRYVKYRDESSKFLWPIVNFAGIHMMPTLVVFASMLPMYEIAKGRIGIMSLPGIAIMLMGISLEHFADTEMHRHLSLPDRKEVCQSGLWKYSRHPNYLGEISFWIGVYVVMLPYAYEYWFYGVGALGIVILFNVVSIPLMEKRQLQRRAGYEQYRRQTSRLLIMPAKNRKGGCKKTPHKK